METKLSGKGRRTLKSIAEQGGYKTAKEVYDLITRKSWPYKVNPLDPLSAKKAARYKARDKALMAIDFVGCFRNNEPLKYKRNPVTHKKELNTNPIRKSNFSFEGKAWLILKDAKISKRTRKVMATTGSRVTIRESIPFPLFTHPLQPFALLVTEYLDMLEPNEILFPIGERRHHEIVKRVTGMWVHWLRAQSENWYGHNLYRKDSMGLAKFIGVVNVQSIEPYIGFDEERHKEALKETAYQDRK